MIKLQNKPLGVLVTRPKHQADNFASEVQLLGAQALRVPVINIESIPLDAATRRQCQIVFDTNGVFIFVSKNAVYSALAHFPLPWPKTIRVAAIGAATAKTLMDFGFEKVIFPQDRYDSEALLDQLSQYLCLSDKIAILGGEQGREHLPVTLSQRGFSVFSVILYRRTLPVEQRKYLQALCLNAEPDIVTITSNAGIKNLLALADQNSADYLKALPLIVNSERAFRLARELGFINQILVAYPAGDHGQIAALRWLIQHNF